MLSIYSISGLYRPEQPSRPSSCNQSSPVDFIFAQLFVRDQRRPDAQRPVAWGPKLLTLYVSPGCDVVKFQRRSPG